LDLADSSQLLTKKYGKGERAEEEQTRPLDMMSLQNSAEILS
jgi:hypothetical protein